MPRRTRRPTMGRTNFFFELGGAAAGVRRTGSPVCGACASVRGSTDCSVAVAIALVWGVGRGYKEAKSGRREMERWPNPAIFRLTLYGSSVTLPVARANETRAFWYEVTASIRALRALFRVSDAVMMSALP